jgi:hypothetical protein
LEKEETLKTMGVQMGNGDDDKPQITIPILQSIYEDIGVLKAKNAELLDAAKSALSLLRGSGFTESTTTLVKLNSAIARSARDK